MRSPSARALRRCVIISLGAICLGLSLVAFTGQAILVYLADFNQTATSAPGGGQMIPALGGQAILQGPPSAVDFEYDATGNGYAVIHGNPTAAPTFLECRLLPPFSGSQCVISFELTRDLDSGDLIFRAADDNDVGAIDIVFDDDGDAIVVVGNLALPLGIDSAQLGQPMTVELELRDQTSGPGSWSLQLEVGQESYHAEGELGSSGPVGVGWMRFIRPATESGGDDVIDDVALMTTISLDVNAQGLIRK